MRAATLAGLLAIAMAAVATAPAMAEPRPGTVVGLDLATPERGAESFVRAWIDGDYFVAYLSLDPEPRFRFHTMSSRFEFPGILGQNLPDGYLDRFLEATGDSQVPGRTIIIDTYAEFVAMMRIAAEMDILPLAFEEDPESLAPTVLSGGDGPLARVALAGNDDGTVLVMRQSPGGLWRVAGFERGDLPAFWIYSE